MNTEQSQIEQHVGELLTGFVDGELTQQQRQRVDLHCQQCEQCRENLAGLRELRTRIGDAHLSEVGEDKWRETMPDQTVKTSRNIGWILFIAGLLVVGAIGLFDFISNTEMSILMKLTVAAIYGGLAVLLFSVLRQRLIERKTDKYKDVEI